MKKQGLRGSAFEAAINKTLGIYREKKLALIQKIPTPITPVKLDKHSSQIKLAYFEKKSTVDYIGVVQEIPVCFDAKECQTDIFPIRNIHEHQFKFMYEFEQQGGVSFILIEFSNKNLVYYMTFKELKKFINRSKTGLKRFKIDELRENFFIDISNKLTIPFIDKLQLDINER